MEGLSDPRGVSGPGVGVSALGVSGPGGAWFRPPRTATAAGGMHPTRMHSCFKYFFEVCVIQSNSKLLIEFLCNLNTSY